MRVDIVSHQKDLKISSRQVQRLVKEVIAYEGKSCDEVAIHFVDEEKICDLHREFFEDPSPTDCISFPIELGNNSYFHLLGDVFICPQAAKNYAEKHNKDPYEEVSLYIVHGLLHLMGYDDIATSDRRKMRGAERRHMRHLKALNLILCV